MLLLQYWLTGNLISYSYCDLIENYDRNSEKIYAVKTYVNSVTSPDVKVTIEFDGNNELGIFHFGEGDSYESNWNVEIDSKKADSLLHQLGWTKSTLVSIKEKLDDANCISIQNGEPFQIGYQRNGMGKYFYNLFSKELTDSQKAVYNDSCTFILYKDKVALEWGGGAIGAQCFPDAYN